MSDGSPGVYRVTGLMNDGSEVVDEYNTVSSPTPSLSLIHVHEYVCVCAGE